MTLAPNWSIVIHHDTSLLEHPYGKVIEIADREGLLEARLMPRTKELCKAMLWRMRPLWFNNASIVACRDVDAIFMARDRVVLESFSADEAWAHCVTDNEAHSTYLMGGMSAYKVEPFRKLFPGSWDEFVAPGEAWSVHGADQNFLHTNVWPKIGARVLVHRLEGKATSSLPIEAISDVPRDVLLGADELAPYVGVSGFDVERAIAFYDQLPQTEPLRRIEASV